MIIGAPLSSAGKNVLTTAGAPPQIAPGVAIAPPPQFVVSPDLVCFDPS